ncbi:hypothetical protein HPB51_004706 [Rhipicephalus microplus]|uniref:Gustatory receptor n=1 Tax=Rhipicephalus microplus TaxID=6941 RepID=A0A9J6DZI1_RHIMP|nr:hypothetical protein HPB51_004706 [Rhipicephalus microplus]
MVARVLWYFRLSRFLGCLFIGNLSVNTMKDAVTTWKSLYTLYAVVWFSTFLAYHVVELMNTSTSVDLDKKFHRYLRFVSSSVVVAKACVNYVSFCLGSESLLEFMRSATAFEMSTFFSPVVKGRLDRRRRLFVAIYRTMLCMSFFGTFIMSVTSSIKNLLPESTPWRAVLVTALLGSKVAVFWYDFMLYVIATRCLDVLLRYLKLELTRLEASCSNNVTVTQYAQLNSASKVAAVRVNVCKIKALKAKLDKICGPAIVASSSSLLALVCLNLYRSLALDVPELELWLPIMYTLYSGLCFIEMAFVSDHLARQVSNKRL